jgi:serine phosphatase RsbU (regulator of sigma subunit)
LPYPLLLRDGTAKFLDLAGIPVGLLPETKYQELDLQLMPGDVLVFYSDGLIEARNETDEDFGLKRLSQVIRENGQASAREIVAAVNQAVDEFVGRVAPHDDRTLIAVKVKD